MGLDISHDTWTGSYSAFMRWRQKIAEVAGMPPLVLMEGFYIPGSYSDPFSELRHYFKIGGSGENYFKSWSDQLPIKWDALKPSPLHILLYHSDCDGDIKYGDAKKIADELEKLLPLLEGQDGGGHIGDYVEKTKAFIAGCRLAYSKKQKLLFQ